MKGQEVCFSKESDEWETPQDLFDRLNGEFQFVLDAAATAGNTKCPPKYLSIEFGVDALTIDWCYHSQGRPVWLNPPYSKIAAFIKKAYEESQKGCTVVCLIPSRTDTKYWHDYVMQADEVRFIKGRLKFNGGKSGAPFPSCIVVFRKTGSDPDYPIMVPMEARI
jgi:site-specific DNA-methyltransferase (adenine-specific)